ncbi:branched-subunit amino acid ABC-type transport system permease component [Ancylobacter vacuolatus]|uniref:Branched-subunit amino acid ABC-type transport system permease component n=1 Tax=Ancylobacter vacuolatus TaxID=223389 RepID=A0ABU0DBU3_9HYPH|nr:branched-chain amino acid ABC transporter permease [Ancylobacter vacuolatus]MDQ0345891.1 branched-subunit amino acid ABC-type transport system permease component [Ancylobacter vacuolatus]
MGNGTRGAQLLLRLALIGFGLQLSGCGSMIDADQARLCRAAAPALHDEAVEIVETQLVPVPNDPTALRYRYRVRSSLGGGPHELICRFAAQTGAGRFNLVALIQDGAPLGEVKLFILKRWWLEDARSQARGAPILRLSPRGAYWLQQALGGLVLMGVYGLIATGFALVHGLYGRINLAFGEVAVAGGIYMLVAVSLASAAGRLGPAGLAMALVAGMSGAALLSWVIGRTVVMPILTRARSPQPVLIATLAVAIVLAEIFRLTSPFRENWLPALINRPVFIAGQDGFVATATPAQFLAAGLTLTGISLLLGLVRFTGYGRSWRAYADDPLMAALTGVRVPQLVGATFALAGGCAGLAGVAMVVAYGTITPGDGMSMTLKALISAIIGGIGSVPGALLGAALVACVEIVWSSAFDIGYRDAVIYSLLAAVLVLRPGGLFQRAALSPREF